jgi:hypothetical protein
MRHRVCLLSLLLALSLWPASLAAQGIRATVTGRVTDSSGAVVPKAKVTITNTGTNEARVAETGDEGEYTLPQLPPGDYTLTVEQAGFKKYVQRFALETGTSRSHGRYPGRFSRRRHHRQRG